MKKGAAIFMVLLSILSFSSCGPQSKKPAEAVTGTPEIGTSDAQSYEPSAPSEAIPRVVNNCGNCAIQGEKIYYINSYDNGTLYSMNTDGSDRKKLNGDIPLYMNVAGDLIYYSGESSGIKGIYSVKTDGTDRMKLTDDSPYLMSVADGWIYYNNENDGFKLYAVRTDGSDRHKLTDDW